METNRTVKTAFAALAIVMAVTVSRVSAGEPGTVQEKPIVDKNDILKANIHSELAALLETHAQNNDKIDAERAKLAVVFCATAERALRLGQLEHAVRYYKLSLSMSPIYQKSIKGLEQVEKAMGRTRNS